MREKLIELFFDYQRKYNSLVVSKDGLVDHLIANGVAILPCKVGDNVYINGIMGVGRAEKHRVKYASYHNVKGYETWFFEADLVCDAPGLNDCGFCESAIGKTVFFTKEEAEAAMPEPPKGESNEWSCDCI